MIVEKRGEPGEIRSYPGEIMQFFSEYEKLYSQFFRHQNIKNSRWKNHQDNKKREIITDEISKSGEPYSLSVAITKFQKIRKKENESATARQVPSVTAWSTLA